MEHMYKLSPLAVEWPTKILERGNVSYLCPLFIGEVNSVVSCDVESKHFICTVTTFCDIARHPRLACSDIVPVPNPLPMHCFWNNCLCKGCEKGEDYLWHQCDSMFFYFVGGLWYEIIQIKNIVPFVPVLLQIQSASVCGFLTPSVQAQGLISRLS